MMSQMRRISKEKKSRAGLLIIICLISLTITIIPSCRRVNLDERIARIENGLRHAVQIRGRSIIKMRLEDRMEQYHVPGVSIAVINGNKIEWAKGYGTTDVNTLSPVTTETLFQAASISKPVAAMAVLHHVQEGRLDLSEDVNRKLTSWKVPENRFTLEKDVTLKGLLSHSAGVTVHGFQGYAHDESVPTLLQVLSGTPPANSDPIRVDIPPDSQFRYSGGGYCITQQLMIDLMDKPFPEIMQEVVLGPVGMNHSTYEQPLPEDKTFWAAAGHRSQGETIDGKYHTYPEMAAAGMWTTPSDLALFAIEIMQSLYGQPERVLSQDMIVQMLTAQYGNYGLGLSVGGSGKNLGFAHGGSNEGFRCFLSAYPERKQGVVIMTNGDNGGYLYSEILRSVSAEYGWEDFKPKTKITIEVNPDIYDDLTGKYQLGPDYVVIITREENRLFILFPDGVKNECFPKSETSYFLTDQDAEVTFIKNDKGEVTEISAIFNGRGMKALKIK
jgi:CubicO group peptidase (beta-lactamase class C family)